MLMRQLVPRAETMRFVLLRQSDGLAPIIEHERVREVTFPGESKSWRTLLCMGRWLRDTHPCDLYHAPADLVPLGFEGRSLVTLHDLMWVEQPELAAGFAPVRWVNRHWYRHSFEHAVRSARRVIAISHATADAIARCYPDEAHKTRVVHHGVEVARQGAVPRAVLRPWLDDEQRFSLIVGQGSPYKNHAGMLRAFMEATRDAPLHKLVMVRRFVRRDTEMRRLLARRDVQRKVITLKHVPRPILRALYQHAHMLLFASHYEGFGLPPLEAMTMGTPVLGSTAAAVTEVTQDSALHADPASHHDLVAKIRRLDRDEALRTLLIERGHRRVAELSWVRCAEQTLAVYREALELPHVASVRPRLTNSRDRRAMSP
jgi:glycosyltransferase involved in cell wall biosynthesis